MTNLEITYPVIEALEPYKPSLVSENILHNIQSRTLLVYFNTDVAIFDATIKEIEKEIDGKFASIVFSNFHEKDSEERKPGICLSFDLKY